MQFKSPWSKFRLSGLIIRFKILLKVRGTCHVTEGRINLKFRFPFPSDLFSLASAHLICAADTRSMVSSTNTRPSKRPVLIDFPSGFHPRLFKIDYAACHKYASMRSTVVSQMIHVPLMSGDSAVRDSCEGYLRKGKTVVSSTYINIIIIQNKKRCLN